MLFDLQGKRRTVIKVAYSLLAGIFVLTFVLFGIGSDVGAGLWDGITGRSGQVGGNDASAIYSNQLEETEKQLAEDPTNPELLVEAARLSFLHGAQLTGTDDEGNMTSTPEAAASFNRALDYWADYLDTEPKKPDVTVAGQLVFAARLMEDAVTAANIQQIVVEQQPSDIAYRDLALFLYAQGLVDEGEEAADEAIRLTSKEEKKEAREWKKELHGQTVEYQEAMAKFREQNPNADTSPQLPNPFGTLGQTPGQLPTGFSQ